MDRHIEIKPIRKVPASNTGITDGLEPSLGLKCYPCGYDLRAHPADGKCPECGTSVVESRRQWAIHSWPSWKDRDPRWRRRIVAGLWILVLIPLNEVLKSSGWSAIIPVPTVINYRGTVNSFEDTYLGYSYDFYQTIMFCMGVVLLFSKERGRGTYPLNWTRRWGVILSYVVLVLSVSLMLTVSGLVLAGIACVFHSLPQKYEPSVTSLMANVSFYLLRFGPHPHRHSQAVLLIFSSLTMVLACVQLWLAFQSFRWKKLILVLIVPLSLMALYHVVQVAIHQIAPNIVSIYDLYYCNTYFFPAALVRALIDRNGFRWFPSYPSTTAIMLECAKWGLILTLAIWLTIAQFLAWRKTAQATE